MAQSEKVTLRDIYDRFDRFEDRMDRRFEDIERNVSALQRYQDNMTGKLTAVLFAISLGINMFIEFIKERILKS